MGIFSVGLLLTLITLLPKCSAWAQSSSANDFYNRDSSGYSYRIAPLPPKIEKDWTLGSVPSQFSFGMNPAGIDVQNYVMSLLQLPDIQTALQQYTSTPLYNDFLLRSFQNPTGASALANVTSLMNQQLTIRMLSDILRRLQLGNTVLGR
jgi:hypothetical protein